MYRFLVGLPSAFLKAALLFCFCTQRRREDIICRPFKPHNPFVPFVDIYETGKRRNRSHISCCMGQCGRDCLLVLHLDEQAAHAIHATRSRLFVGLGGQVDQFVYLLPLRAVLHNIGHLSQLILLLVPVVQLDLF